MKMLTIFLFATCLQVHANISAQTVTLKVSNTSLENVFKEIQRQTGYDYIINSRFAKVAKSVSIEVKNTSIDLVLQECFKDQPFTYEILDKTIIIKEKESPKNAEAAPSAIQPPPPNIDVTIIVTNSDGQSLDGASVTIKGQNKGAATDIQGRAILKNIYKDAIVVVSFTGYQNQEIKINNRTTLVVRLMTSTSELDEVQIGAYTKTTKRFQTGNQTTVKGEDIEKQPVPNVLEAIANRVPGLNIIQSNGLNGGGITVRIQGQGSLSYGSDPLFVIDGVPILSQLRTTGAGDAVLGSSGNGSSLQGPLTNQAFGSPLSYLNTADIESVEVLKDAAATSIYGSQAAAGAIIITTKKGKPGPTKLSINLQSGWSTVPQMLDMLNTSQYIQMRREALKNDGVVPSSSPTASGAFKYAPDLTLWDNTRYTDWQKTLIGGTAQYTNINGSVSGGTSNVNYIVGATYGKRTTVFPGDYNDQQGSIHFNLNTSSVNKKFNFGITINYMVDINKLPSQDPTKYISDPPNTPTPYNSDGSLNWAPNPAGASTWDNPYKLFYAYYKNNTNNLTSNMLLSYRIAAGLDIESSFGYSNMQTNDFNGTPLTMIAPESRTATSRRASYGNRGMNSFIIEPKLRYKRRLYGGTLAFLAGATLKENSVAVTSINGSGYSSDLLLQNPSAANPATTSYYNTKQKYVAAFGSLNYRFKERYVFDATTRTDGSSRFGPDNRYHTFWGVSGAWIFTEEDLFKKAMPFLSFGKLRASYGTSGSDQIGDYTYLNLYNPSNVDLPPQGVVGLQPNALVNNFLAWEETHKFSIGIDLGLLSDRVFLGVTFSRNVSSNQLKSDPIATVTGFNTILENFPGTIRNSDWEFEVRSTNIKERNFSWKTNLNITIPRNKLLSFGGQTSYPFYVGQPLDVKTLYHFLGVDPQTGVYLVQDRFGNPTKNPVFSTTQIGGDNVISRSGFSDFDGGILNSFTYKGFSLDVFFSLVKRFANNNFFTSTGNVPGSYAVNSAGGNILETTFLNAWHQPGDNALISKFSAGASGSIPASDASFENAFFARLKNLSLSYQFPDKWKKRMHVNDCSIYAQGQNLITISNFKGLDPETLAISTLPPLRTFTLGLRVVF